MNAWWSGRTAREKLLLRMAALAAITFLVIQLLIVPGLARREAAEVALNAARSTHARLDRIEGLAPAERAAMADLSDSWTADQFIEAAAGLGLTPAPQSDADALRFEFVAARPEALFAWIGRIEAETTLRVRAASLTLSGNGLVDARVTLAPGVS